VTAQPQAQPTVVPTAQVAELIGTMVKALRAFQIYLPNNPIYQRAVQNVQAACTPIWAAGDELVLNISESEFICEDQVVYRQVNKNESLTWSLFKDGMRAVTIRRGAEEKELPLLLATINKARFLPPDAGDDLPTLLWAHEFEFIEYRFIDFFSGDGGGTVPQASAEPIAAGQSPATRKAQIAEEAPPRPKALVDLDDGDSTLYFLDEAEISYLARELEQEYERDVRGSAFNILFDLFEVNPDPNVRQEILRILERLFPNLLNARDFRSVAAVLRESKLLRERAPQIQAELVQRLDGFVEKLSEPAIVGQLLQSLDEASNLGVDSQAAEVLRELRASALESLVSWLPNLTSEPLRKMLEEVVDRLAHAYPLEVQRILKLPESPALLGMVNLCGRLGLNQAVQGLAEAVAHSDPAIRLAVVQTLGLLGTHRRRQGPRRLRPQCPACGGACGWISRLQGGPPPGGGRGPGEGGQRYGPDREDGLLRSLRLHRRRQRPEAAQCSPPRARSAADERATGDAGLRRHGPRSSEDPGGPRGAATGR
jgi:hypothetical protein